MQLHREAPIILTTSELRLTDVPEHAREGIRAFLAPFLRFIPIKRGECFDITERLKWITSVKGVTPRVEIVAGVWRNVNFCPERPGARVLPMPHAWNTVDGYRVDLLRECKDLYDYETRPQPDWRYEPLNDVETTKWLAEEDQSAYLDIFKPAMKRLLSLQGEELTDESYAFLQRHSPNLGKLQGHYESGA
jgi:hypothetical protein